MNARKIRTQTSAEIMHRLVPPLAEAEAGRESVESPAALLQRRLDAALAAAPWAGAPAPHVVPWSGAVRLSVLGVGAAASWAAVLLAFRALI